MINIISLITPWPVRDVLSEETLGALITRMWSKLPFEILSLNGRDYKYIYYYDFNSDGQFTRIT